MDLLTDGLQASGEWKISETHIGSDKTHFSIYPAVIYQASSIHSGAAYSKSHCQYVHVDVLNDLPWERMVKVNVRARADVYLDRGEYDEQVKKLWWVTWVKGQIN